MTTKKKLFVLAAGYQLIPLLLIAAWIMPEFFDLFGVSWNDRSWRMYAATAGGWLILELPLFVAVAVVIMRPRKTA